MTPMIMPQGLGLRAWPTTERRALLTLPLPLGLFAPLLFVPLAMPVSVLVSIQQDSGSLRPASVETGCQVGVNSLRTDGRGTRSGRGRVERRRVGHVEAGVLGVTARAGLRGRVRVLPQRLDELAGPLVVHVGQLELVAPRLQ